MVDGSPGKETSSLLDIRTPRPTRLHEGGEAARERSKQIDEVLASLVGETFGSGSKVALVAVGGYGRGELSPHSDIDLLFVLGTRVEATPAKLRGTLYPLWDAGFQVGHAVRTPKDAVDRSGQDLDHATALLSARFVAGDPAPFEELVERHQRWLHKERSRLVRRIQEATAQRHATVDRAGWALAPDLKDDAGGLRDLHVLFWLERVTRRDAEVPTLAGAGDLLLAVREALHAEVKRKSDRIRIDLQPAVARRMGLTDDDGPNELMAEVHSTARTVEHRAGLAARELAAVVLGGPRRSGVARQVSRAVRLADGELHADHGANDDPVEDALELLAAAAETGRTISPASLTWLEGCFEGGPIERWTAEMRAAFAALLRGPHAAEALEITDHVRGWAVLLPEWLAVRGLAQYDPYHRYTVDGHSFIAVRCARDATVSESDPLGPAAAAETGDLTALYLGALLHDVGKGSGEDHSVAGERIAQRTCARMGLDRDTADDVCFLVRHHLLLVDTATRRDLDDGAVIGTVAATVATPRRLRMLYLLTVADGRATGPEGWSDWKGALVRDLYLKVMTALETGELPARSDVAARAREIEAYEPALAGRVEPVLATLPPSYLASTSVPDAADDVRLLLSPPRSGHVKQRIDPGTEPGQISLTICVEDRPGTLARTAGVLALHRVSVRTASAFSTTDGAALQRFIVDARDGISWADVTDDLSAAYSGRLALEARLDRKVAEYRPVAAIHPDIRVLQEESEHSTVIEVRAADALGLLWAITAALTELDLDIHVAKIDTLGSRVVDVFYVRSAWGEKLNDGQASETKRSIEHRVRRLFS
ncbi:MAG TPA: [protein-PII] uridylyltransferase [Actinomycetota bacterium]|nr:[protein-PII] uridylyltransferase [Actinomycetota bacterium]